MIVEKHSRLPRKVRDPLADPARSGRASRNLPVSPARRSTIIRDALRAIEDAHETVADIAARHGITRHTLQTWLLGLGEEYAQIRARWLDSLLAESEQALLQAADPLALARAREHRRATEWYAERRDRARYGDQPVAQLAVAPIFQVTIVAPTPQIAVQHEDSGGAQRSDDDVSA